MCGSDLFQKFTLYNYICENKFRAFSAYENFLRWQKANYSMFPRVNDQELPVSYIIIISLTNILNHMI